MDGGVGEDSPSSVIGDPDRRCYGGCEDEDSLQRAIIQLTIIN